MLMIFVITFDCRFLNNEGAYKMHCYNKLKSITLLVFILALQAPPLLGQGSQQQPVEIDGNISEWYAGSKQIVASPTLVVPASLDLPFEHKDECFEIRGINILGSSTASTLVGEVNTCNLEKGNSPTFVLIRKVVLNLGKNQNNDIAAIIPVLDDFLEGVRQLVLKEPKLYDAKWLTVGTAWARDIQDDEQVMQLFEEKGLGPLKIIDQAQEAKYALLSAQMLTNEPIEVTYDSGGKSFQVLIGLDTEENKREDQSFIGVFGTVGMHPVKKAFNKMAGESFLPLPTHLEEGYIISDYCEVFADVCDTIISSAYHSITGEAISPLEMGELHRLTASRKMYGVTRSLNYSVLPLIVAVRKYAPSIGYPLSDEGIAFQSNGIEGPGAFNLLALHEAIGILIKMSPDMIRSIALSAASDPLGDFSNTVLIYVVLKYLKMDYVEVLKVENSLQSLLEAPSHEWISYNDMLTLLKVFE